MTCVQRDEGGVQARERERVHAAGGRGGVGGNREIDASKCARWGMGLG